MAINTSQIQQLLRPGLSAAFGDFAMYPAQWPEIFDTYESDKNQEIESEQKFLGLGQIRPEGAPTAVDTMGQRIVTTYVHRYVGLSFVITRMALLDNLYKSKFPHMVKSLKRSLAQTKEILAASVLNNAFDAAFPLGDGQPLCSLNHPIDGGVVANTPVVQSDLTEAALEAAVITIQQFRDQAGLIIHTKPKKMIVPTAGQFVAERLLGSAFRVDTNVNTISAIYNTQVVPEGYRVNQFLTPLQPNAWFLLTDSPDSFKHFIREKVETDVYTEQSTDNLIAKAVERYSFGVSNFRGVYGSNGP